MKLSFAVLKMQWMEEGSLGGVWRVWERRKRASKRRVGRYLTSGCLVEVRGEEGKEEAANQALVWLTFE